MIRKYVVLLALMLSSSFINAEINQIPVINLENKDISIVQKVPKVDWAFYPNQFVSPETLNNTYVSAFDKVPGRWDRAQLESGEAFSKKGYGTYAANLILPEGTTCDGLAIKTSRVKFNYRLFINGQLIYSAGNPGTSPETTVDEYKPRIHSLSDLAQCENLTVMFHQSNFLYWKGGISDPIKIGPYSEFQRHSLLEKEYRVLSATILVVFAVLALILGIHFRGLRKVESERYRYIFFSIFAFAMGIRIVFVSEKLIHDFLPSLPPAFTLRIDLLMVFIAFPALFSYMFQVFPARMHIKGALFATYRVFKFLSIVVGVGLSLICILNVYWAGFLISVAYLYIIPVLFFMLIVSIVLFIRKVPSALVFVFTNFLMFGAAFNDIMYELGVFQIAYLVSLSSVVLVLTNIITLSRDFAYVQRETDRLKEEKKRSSALLGETSSKFEDSQNQVVNLLHDEVCSDLVMVKSTIMEGAHISEDGSLSPIYIQKALSTLSKAYTKTKVQVDNLRSYSPSLLGLNAGIEGYVRDRANETPRVVSNLDLNYDVRNEPRIVNVLYQSVAELIQNAIRHSNAKTITVSSRFYGDTESLVITVTDDGVGFNASSENYNFGLSLIASRFQKHGIDWRIKSKMNIATTIRIKIPKGYWNKILPGDM